MRMMTIGPITVPCYGAALTVSAALAALLLYFLARRHPSARRAAGLYAVLALVLGFLGAWLGYALVNLNWVREHGIGVMAQGISGRLLPYGAVLGCMLAAFTAGRARSCPVPALLDTAAAPLCLMATLTRFAEPLAGMGYGRNIYDWFDPWMEQSMFPWEDPSPLFRFPFAVQDHYGEWNFNISLPEALAALALVVVCLCMKKRREGGKFLLAVLVYAALQIVFESMRQDAVMRWGFVRANQLLSAVAVVVCAVVCCNALPRANRSVGKTALVIIAQVVCLGIAGAMEFALEKKIGFLVSLRMDACYLIMLAACAAMVLVVLPSWKKAFPQVK